MKISCIEEIAYRLGYINSSQLENLGNKLKNTLTGNICWLQKKKFNRKFLA